MRLRGLKILSGGDFKHYQNNSFGCRSGVILLLVSREPTSETMVGFVITRKVGSAVKRNKIRRRLRALVTSLASERGFSPRSYIFIPSPAAAFSEFATIGEDVLSCLEKVSISHSI